MQKLISLLFALLLTAGILVLPASAAPSATLTGPSTVRAGDTITLTLSVNGSGILGAGGEIAFDSTALELKSTKQVIASPWMVEFNGMNFVAYDNNQENPINKKTSLLSLTFRVKSGVNTGTRVTVSVKNGITSDGSADISLGSISYSTTIAPPMSSENALQNLTVSNATISPAFSATVTSYTAEVPFEVSKLEIKATAKDGKASVSIDAPTLKPNATTRVTVTVTAENGSKKEYVISVKRAQDPNYVPSGENTLASLQVEGFLLSPVFRTDLTQYLIWLPYEVERVTVTGTATSALASVRVEGGDSLTAGEDTPIRVICSAENGEEKVYTVIAKRAAAHDGEETPSETTAPVTDEPTTPTEPATSNDPTSNPADTDGEPNTVPSTGPQQSQSEPSATTPQEETEQPDGLPLWAVILSGSLGLAAGLTIGFFAKRNR